MGCTTCGSSTPCGCVNTAVGRTCRCGNPTCCGTCGCNAPVPATPLPFYACAPVCLESHTQKVILQQFYTTISVANTWNVPVCGAQATLNVLGLQSANPGSYIWNSTYGFFEIISFDISTGQLVVQNNCNDGNATAGTTVPGCTDFTITVPPCDCSDTSTICVAIDFTAPANGDCVDITLTETTGLTASDTIQIGSGFYFLSAIKPNNVVTICNHGDGITPGTPVIARDVNGNYQYCISIISTNACDRAAEKEVILIGCGTDEVTVPLQHLSQGWVATQLRENDDNAAYRPLGADDTTCTTLTAIFTLTNAVSVYANVAVANSSVFQVGDVLALEGGSTFRFTVTNIPNGTHIDVTVSPVPAGTSTFPSGSVLCLQSCCESLETEVLALPFLSQSNQATDNGPFAAVTALNPTVNGANFTFTITNPSSTKSMNVMLIMRAIVTGTAGADLGPPSSWSFGGFLVYTLNGGAPNSVGYRYSGYGSFAAEGVGPEPMDFYIVEHQSQTIAPSGVLTVVAHGQIAFETPDIGETSSYTATKVVTSYSVLGIPA